MKYLTEKEIDAILKIYRTEPEAHSEIKIITPHGIIIIPAKNEHLLNEND